MNRNVSPFYGYLLAVILGAFGGGVLALVVTRAIPKMMSRIMAHMMPRMMQNMREQMKDSGCSPDM